MSRGRSAWAEEVAAAYDGVADAEVVEDFPPLTVSVPAASWVEAVEVARDRLGCDFWDFLTAVDEGDGLRVVCHVARLGSEAGVAQVLLSALLDQDAPRVATLEPLFAGARWHERETAEMFGVTFTDETGADLVLEPLLLPPGGTRHPLRKDVTLAAREERAWPGELGGDRG